MQTKIKAREEGDLYRDKPKFPNKKLRMTVDLPISVNSMYINTRTGGKRLTKLAESYVCKTKAMVSAYIVDGAWKKQNDSTWYYLRFLLTCATGKCGVCKNLFPGWFY